MNEMQVFNNPEFGEVRTIEENGAILFCGSDVAKALGYTNPSKAINDHCRGDLTKRYPIVDALGRTQGAIFIPESDLYRLVFSSKLPTAEKFTDWVTKEVLPSIRKTGGYALPKDYPSALRALADAEETKLRLLAENQQQAQVIADFEPIRQYVDTILESNNGYLANRGGLRPNGAETQQDTPRRRHPAEREWSVAFVRQAHGQGLYQVQDHPDHPL